VRDQLDPERIAAWRKLQRELAWVEDRRAASRQRERQHRRLMLDLRKEKH
jgi:ribosome biogenesis GTPase